MTSIAALSQAGTPSPYNCTVPPVIVACPAGDVPYTVVVRDATNSPYDASQVTLDFSACPGVRLCAPDPGTKYTFLTSSVVAVISDGYGDATFWLEAGGGCTSGIQITVSEKHDPTRNFLLTNGIDHASVSFAGFDQNGDGMVTSLDATILAAKGPSDPTADLNADGVHDAADDALLAAHLQHACAALPTPAHGKSWGQLKLIYR
ncbi:MAG: hypothetical protein ACRENS_01645 [Candidatus Eiseniibacteriota bacterium]